jgi:hypothetical protein
MKIKKIPFFIIILTLNSVNAMEKNQLIEGSGGSDYHCEQKPSIPFINSDFEGIVKIPGQINYVCTYNQRPLREDLNKSVISILRELGIKKMESTQVTTGLQSAQREFFLETKNLVNISNLINKENQYDEIKDDVWNCQQNYFIENKLNWPQRHYMKFASIVGLICFLPYLKIVVTDFFQKADFSSIFFKLAESTKKS